MKVVESTNRTAVSSRAWKMTLPRMMAVLVFLVVLAFNVQAVRDPDLWWHLAVGEYMLETGGIPTADPNFAFTTEGKFWFMHEWLSEIVMILVYNVADLEGLSIFFGVVVALTYLLIYLASPGRPYLPALVTIVVSFGGFYIRRLGRICLICCSEQLSSFWLNRSKISGFPYIGCG